MRGGRSVKGENEPRVGRQLLTYHGELCVLCPERAAKRSATIVGVGAVMPDEDATVAAIAIEGPAELSDLGRRLDPARSFRIELAQFLEREIFFFGQKLDAHGCGHTDGAILRLIFFSRRQRFIVVTKTHAIAGRLG